MNGIQSLKAFLVLGLASFISPAVFAEAGLCTGQGLVDARKVVSIGQAKVSEVDTAMLLLCLSLL